MRSARAPGPVARVLLVTLASLGAACGRGAEAEAGHGVMLAKNLEVDVIAEGVETKQQFLHLRATGCTHAQGFYFSGAVGPAEAEVLIRDGYALSLKAAGAA